MSVKSILVAAIAAGCLVFSSADARAARHVHTERAFPIKADKADEYRKSVEARVDRVRAAIEKKLEKNGVSIERRKQIGKIIDAAAHEVKNELDKAAADGTITREEAKKIDALAAGLRSTVRARLAKERKANKSQDKDAPRPSFRG